MDPSTHHTNPSSASAAPNSARVTREPVGWDWGITLIVFGLVVAAVLAYGPYSLWKESCKAAAAVADARTAIEEAQLWERKAVPEDVTIIGRKRENGRDPHSGESSGRYYLLISRKTGTPGQTEEMDVGSKNYGQFAKGSKQVFWSHPDYIHGSLTVEPPTKAPRETEPYTPAYRFGMIWSFVTWWPTALLLLSFFGFVKPPKQHVFALLFGPAILIALGTVLSGILPSAPFQNQPYVQPSLTPPPKFDLTQFKPEPKLADEFISNDPSQAAFKQAVDRASALNRTLKSLKTDLVNAKEAERDWLRAEVEEMEKLATAADQQVKDAGLKMQMDQIQRSQLKQGRTYPRGTAPPLNIPPKVP